MLHNIKCWFAFLTLLWEMLIMNMAGAKQAVWIDTDPACGHEKTDDVDDCWALLLALQSDELEILGISTAVR